MPATSETAFNSMAKITFITRAGESRSIDVDSGLTLMEAAVDNGINDIVAECGGACACATCHVYVDADWIGKLPSMDGMEDAMLDAAMDRRDSSRLSCQIEISDALDGLTVTVADNDG
jgi:2Fe-2S ferredoxin